jgi:undecaprenyl-diphosphatase
MLETISRLDQALFLWLNGWHHPALDGPMAYITGTATWIPLYALIVGWLGWLHRRRAVAVVVVIALAITLADQFASGLMKPLVGRLRPCHQPEIAAQVHTIVGCGGQFGFVSSHAANSFALATLIFLLGRPYARYRWLGWAMFGWAALVSYSRIYAGVHYPTDLLGGGAAGAAIAGALGWAARRLRLKPFWQGENLAANP